MLEIIRGLKYNLNVSWYANPKFSFHQMEQIRLGLEAKLDPTLYAYSDISADKIGKIIKILIEE